MFIIMSPCDDDVKEKCRMIYAGNRLGSEPMPVTNDTENSECHLSQIQGRKRGGGQSAQGPI
jgi:hypothetical protein